MSSLAHTQHTTLQPNLSAAIARETDGGLARDVVNFSSIVPANWVGKHGADLAGEEIRLRFVGNLDGPKVFILGGISGTRYVADDGNGGAGWWSEIAKFQGAIDLETHCVIGADYVPERINSEQEVCPEDFARLFHSALVKAGVTHLEAFVGASFGGMIGLSFCRIFPNFARKLVVISAAHRPHPMAQAWRLIQRRTIRFAVEAGRPEEGIALARQLAMTTYRSAEEFGARFSPDLQAPDNIGPYLKARGDDYANRTNAARYLSLSGAIDRHSEEPENIIVPTLIIGALSDRLVPTEDLTELQRRLGGPADYIGISSRYGHDAFLKDTAVIGRHIEKFLGA